LLAAFNAIAMKGSEPIIRIITVMKPLYVGVQSESRVDGLRNIVFTNAINVVAVAKIRSPASAATAARMTATTDTYRPKNGMKIAIIAIAKPAIPNPFAMDSRLIKLVT
jgi:hypothetical protein